METEKTWKKIALSSLIVKKQNKIHLLVLYFVSLCFIQGDLGWFQCASAILSYKLGLQDGKTSPNRLRNTQGHKILHKCILFRFFVIS